MYFLKKVIVFFTEIREVMSESGLHLKENRRETSSLKHSLDEPCAQCMSFHFSAAESEDTCVTCSVSLSVSLSLCLCLTSQPVTAPDSAWHTAGGLMMGKSAAFLPGLLVLSAVLVTADGYRPVIIVHGLFDGPRQFIQLASFINHTYPGINVTTVDMYDDIASLKPLWEQVNRFRKAVGHIMENAKDGIHLICFSQGGLVCRGIIATLPKHNVHSLIFLSSPLSGQYGVTSYLRYAFPKCLKHLVYKLCYNCFGQKISICNFWNDPHQRERYLKSNKYLALLNGEIKHPNLTEWRERFLGIKKLVLIGGPDDGVITPWQSSHFGFYNSKETVVEMKQQDWYLSDVFGLKTLDSRGDLVQCVFSDVEHTRWHSNLTVYTNCIEKWLT
ncbi:lysosomal thioesterase PPT2 [Pangasianodon hypophthalmus]|uniref:lysosomal thioesterase PPT2 n=1 Tax=Pangasianodon hypophthalmus TaxID=310915 RepID=UPI000EFF16F8|nr:lysosomal thioesterase PPT2 [Pangasianodon hypophthalmus]